ncbi:hypothetical protein HBI56_166530 [Parastagonospora nodorum]|uniref:Uncharacterized protein n=1 Tax=Phaeosphaeria nodorum (strain SN15 / ATCC MYA-4574 / FGSC 10173) TaxID=321614 RepID=A0A7U2IBH3_PHANO|nr:hypothetical protein HBH56_074290 [Parastagonospora nodorum]QRD06761.1 hypothetical protein JI435_423670 [Parastagonospora nodorum SN15]KAH3927214.1 hypothetical protein HBH54_154530 [Parastagonospora nodorum]KAH3952199.1 hypothetical protein HBH53_053810 [Parastagonospora nodorum]KAH3981721.1 hypothetical protein HBH51_041290 [Parastagonospora nodorum]
MKGRSGSHPFQDCASSAKIKHVHILLVQMAKSRSASRTGISFEAECFNQRRLAFWTSFGLVCIAQVDVRLKPIATVQHICRVCDVLIA